MTGLAIAAGIMGGGYSNGMGLPVNHSGGGKKFARPFGNKPSGTKAQKKWEKRMDATAKCDHWGMSSRLRAIQKNRRKRERLAKKRAAWESSRPKAAGVRLSDILGRD